MGQYRGVSLRQARGRRWEQSWQELPWGLPREVVSLPRGCLHVCGNRELSPIQGISMLS